MKTDSIYNAFKCQLDNCKENTLLNLTAEDSEYQKLSYQLSMEEKRYQQLDLTPAQRSAIDGFIELTDTCNMEYSTLSYLSGLIDSQRVGMLFPVPEDQTDNGTAIHNFYNNILQPCAHPCETPETLNLWKQNQADEDTLMATFTPEQTSAFEELLSRRTEGLKHSMADSFQYGFQLSAKILMTLLD